MIFYKSLSLDEGFELAKLDKNSRIVAGREVSLASGFRLFETLRGTPIRCWHCGCEADQWISCRGQNDNSRPVLNLFATRHYKATKKRAAREQIVMMTRDHIIPKSMGGMDSVENLRPGCELCNGQRGSNMSKDDILFMAAHPELISPERLAKAQAAAARAAARQLEREHANQ